MQWKERARWIKFEEDVEQNEQWGKPHIASLSFHSLLELRKGIESGTRKIKNCVDLTLHFRRA